MIVEERVILVDEQDNMIGTEEKIKTHRLGLLHRAFSIFVYRRMGDTVEFLLQQRHQKKYHCGGLWTNACCSHPRLGETILDAATRRLKEEMSLEMPLTHIGQFLYRARFDNGLTEHELDHVFIGEYDRNYSIVMDEREVEGFRWISEEQLEQELAFRSEQFTPWFLPAFNLVREVLCIKC